MRHVAPPHGHPLRHDDPPPRPAWARGARPTRSDVVDDIPSDVLRRDLEAAGLSDFVVDLLVKDRDTAGAKWRITQELAL